jgi:hypothetical protein
VDESESEKPLPEEGMLQEAKLLERIEKDRLDELEKQRVEKERVEKERLDKLEKQRVEAERLEKERLEELEKQRVEKERLEKERLEEMERQRVEKVRLDKLMDSHDNVCQLCYERSNEKNGELAFCSACPRSFHITCLPANANPISFLCAHAPGPKHKACTSRADCVFYAADGKKVPLVERHLYDRNGCLISNSSTKRKANDSAKQVVTDKRVRKKSQKQAEADAARVV